MKKRKKVFEISEIKKHYERFDDDRIRIIAKNEAKGLRNEIIPILTEEIKKRNLGDHLIKWINAERRKLSTSEFELLKRKVKNSICVSCKQSRNLKGYEFSAVTGVLIGEIVTDYRLIICEKCGKKRRRNSAIWTAVFGWWSAKGLIWTPLVLINTVKAVIQEEKQSGEIIKSFIESHIGRITLGKDSEDVIQKLLKEFNGSEDFDEFDDIQTDGKEDGAP